MKVAAIQHDIVWEDGPATRARLTTPIAQAVATGAELVVLTEMYATGFSMRTDVTAEDPGGPNEQFLISQAAHHRIWLIASIAQWSAPAAPTPGQRRATNTAIVAGPDGQCHRYAKIHPFSYGDEHRYFDAGTEFLTVSVGNLRVSVFVCYDLRFADEFWALAPQTDLYVVVANWPARRRDHWRTLLAARAIENQAYVVGCNRVGTVPPERGPAQRELAYVGDSVILDPLGRPLVEAREAETMLLADIDPAEVQRTRDRFGFLADRR